MHPRTALNHLLYGGVDGGASVLFRPTGDRETCRQEPIEVEAAFYLPVLLEGAAVSCWADLLDDSPENAANECSDARDMTHRWSHRPSDRQCLCVNSALSRCMEPGHGAMEP